MARRAAELSGLPHRTTEEIRQYGRAAHEVLSGMTAEFDFRRSESFGQLIATYKLAKRKGLTTMSPAEARMAAARTVAQYAATSAALRIASFAVKRYYSTMEAQFGHIFEGLRDQKYGKGKSKPSDGHVPVEV